MWRNRALYGGENGPRSKMRIFMDRLGRFILLVSSLFAGAVLAQTDRARGVRPYTTWTAYGGAIDSSQYSALTQINTSNVPQLEVVWTLPVTGSVILNP